MAFMVTSVPSFDRTLYDGFSHGWPQNQFQFKALSSQPGTITYDRLGSPLLGGLMQQRMAFLQASFCGSRTATNAFHRGQSLPIWPPLHDVYA